MAALTSGSMPYLKQISAGVSIRAHAVRLPDRKTRMKGAAMNCQLEQTPLGTFDQETVEPHAANAVKRAKGCRSRREIAKGSGAYLAKDTRAVLRLRLCSAASIQLIGFMRHVLTMVVAAIAAVIGRRMNQALRREPFE